MAEWSTVEAGGHIRFFLTVEGRQRKQASLFSYSWTTCTHIHTHTHANWQTLVSLCCHWQDEVWPLKCNYECSVHVQYVRVWQLESISGDQWSVLLAVSCQGSVWNSWYVGEEEHEQCMCLSRWTNDEYIRSTHSCPWLWETQMCEYSLWLFVSSQSQG